MASKYPFDTLANVGDSAEFNATTTINAVRVAASLYGKRHGMKLRVKHLGDQPESHSAFRVERVG